MSGSLFDRGGTRKYLIAEERRDFVRAAARHPMPVRAFCVTLAVTGARISEVLALTSRQIDSANETLVFETLKRRRSGIFRAVPVPPVLVEMLTGLRCENTERLWPWCRTTAWKNVKGVMISAGIDAGLCKPKALRHAFAIEAGQNGIPLNMVQRWLGHARLETTAIYAAALGREEKRLAKQNWRFLRFASLGGGIDEY